jgi:sugar/nucleoside kinase (ribokinase family)
MVALIIGHLVLDEIHALDGSIYEGLGGISFPLHTFAALAQEQDVLLPVFPVGVDAVSEFESRVHSIQQLDRAGLYTVEQPNTRVRLYHESRSQYNTRLVASLETISAKRILPHTPKADLVYINMMTGKDIDPDTICAIRSVSSALIFLDLHMIAYAVGHDGARHLASVPQWQIWIENVDVLQCNEQEFENFVPGIHSEEQRAELLFSNSDLKLILVTKAESGSTIYQKSGPQLNIPAVKATKIVDPTGCGDVFGSVFAYIYVLKQDVGYAARMAAHAASFVVGIPGSQGISALRTYLEDLK